MIKKINSIKKVEILNEIIERAIELPLESQNLLLFMAKAMQYTRNCFINQNKTEKK